MNSGRTVFAELIEHLPHKVLLSQIGNYAGYLRKLTRLFLRDFSPPLCIA